MQITFQQLEKAEIPQAFYALQRGTYRGSQKTLSQFEHYLLNFVKSKGKDMPFLFLDGPTLSGKTFFGTYFLRTVLATQPEADVLYLTVERLTDRYFSMDRLPRANVYFLDNMNETENLGHKTAVSAFVSMCHDEGCSLAIATRIRSQDMLVKSYGLDTVTLLNQNSLTLQLAISAHELAQIRAEKLKKLSDA